MNLPLARFRQTEDWKEPLDVGVIRALYHGRCCLLIKHAKEGDKRRANMPHHSLYESATGGIAQWEPIMSKAAPYLDHENTKDNEDSLESSTYGPLCIWACWLLLSWTEHFSCRSLSFPRSIPQTEATSMTSRHQDETLKSGEARLLH